MSVRPVSSVAVVNALTFDIEDYFQASVFDDVVRREDWGCRESRVRRNTDRILGVLDEMGVRATFFVLGWVAERFPGLIKSIGCLQHEIACHSYWHRLVYEQGPEEFRADLRRGRAALEDIIGSEVRGFRAPSFSVTNRSIWALDVLIDEGFTYDASVFPIHHDRYGMPHAPRYPHRIEREGGGLWEVPASTVRVGHLNVPVGGGGYFRLLPYAWTRWGFSRLNRVEHKPAVFYLHPWEIDADQPRLPVSWSSRLRHYSGLASTLPRLRLLLADFRFDTVSTLLRSSDSVLPVVRTS